MIDPRESKLPKWAIELLEAERTRAALAWPSEPRPEPLWKPGANTHVQGRFKDGTSVWRHVGNYGGTRAVQRMVIRGPYVCAPDGGTGSRPENTPYFATERQAALDAQWHLAEEAAKSLHAAQRVIERIDAEE